MEFFERPSSSQLWCYARRSLGSQMNNKEVVLDIELFDQYNQLIAKVTGFQGKKIPRQVLQKSWQAAVNNWLYKVDWQPQTLTTLTKDVPSQTQGNWLIFADQSSLETQFRLLEVHQIDYLGRPTEDMEQVHAE